MNYVILDLEWNQSAQGKMREIPGLPFEIIEIGAVMVDEGGNVIKEFSELIRPKVYKQLHFKTREIIHVKMSDLKKARPFTAVMNSFLQWCGKEYMFCTWGSMDLTELQRNMKFHQIKNPFACPLLYYDIQKLYSINHDDGKTRVSLEEAVERLEIEKNKDFHQAFADAYYAMLVMGHIDMNKVGEYVSVDYYRPPTNKNEEIFLKFGTYAKYVSRVFDTREEAIVDRNVVSTRCYKCNRLLRRKIKWFTTNQKTYICLSYCSQDGYMKGKLRIKKTDDGKVFTIKTLKMTDENGAQSVIARREELRKKRREKNRLLKKAEDNKKG